MGFTIRTKLKGTDPRLNSDLIWFWALFLLSLLASFPSTLLSKLTERLIRIFFLQALLDKESLHYFYLSLVVPKHASFFYSLSVPGPCLPLCFSRAPG